jgi:hypothetical protein
MQEGAPLVEPEWGDNIMASRDIVLGDPDAAFAEADGTVSAEFRVQSDNTIFYLQGLYGSDGTRTRDPGRDRPVRARPAPPARGRNYWIRQESRTDDHRL